MKTLYNITRFLNILEPGRWILSISKVFMWCTVFAFMYVIFNYPDQLLPVMGALWAQGVATGNYAYRRHVQMKAGNTDAAASVTNK